MPDNEEVDQKPDVKPEKITVTVRGTDGVVTKFMLKPTAKFEKVFTAFECKRSDSRQAASLIPCAPKADLRFLAPPGTYKFLSSEGVMLLPQDIVGDYNWEEEEEISAALAQHGGAFLG
ncbi:hypothetical protein FRC04_001631 [Tulasnella sp. 424]|nr:hypothetical protein FRC04_001631 [Tulasnella sp. 424]KAG8968658.1 hypothetical protein FRC05_001464 [Tulasnella sp. 425]